MTTDDMLLESLDLLDQGLSVEQILARYPEAADELRPFLETAVQLTQLSVQPTVAAKKRSQAVFLEEAAALRATGRPQVSPWLRLRQWLMPVAALAVVLLLLGATLVFASSTALPGDTLYGAKLFVENVRLRLTTNPENIVLLSEQFRQERIREVEALLRAGRTADVTFEGRIAAIGDMRWVIDGLEVAVTAETTIEGRPEVDELARVNGRTSGGDLVADRIIVLTGDGTVPEPIVPPTPTPTATQETPSPTATVSPTATPSPTPTVTNTATPAPSLTATPAAVNTPTAVATAPPPTAPPPPPPTAVPDDNGGSDDNDNGDDNANHNDDGGANDNGDDGANANDDGPGDDGGGNSNDDHGGDDNANDDGGSDDNDNGDDNANDNDSGGGNDNDDNGNDNDDDNANDGNANDNDDDDNGGRGSDRNDNDDEDDDNNDNG